MWSIDSLRFRSQSDFAIRRWAWRLREHEPACWHESSLPASCLRVLHYRHAVVAGKIIHGWYRVWKSARALAREPAVAGNGFANCEPWRAGHRGGLDARDSVGTERRGICVRAGPSPGRIQIVIFMTGVGTRAL